MSRGSPPDHSLLDRVASLTRREREVLSLIGQGLTLPEIAEQLYRSQKTIESHRLALGRKLGATSRVELARIAIRVGLAPLEDETPGHAAPMGQALRGKLAQDTAAWERLRRIDAALAATTGAAAFRRLARLLAEELAVRCALVSELRQDGTDGPRTLVTVAASERGRTMRAWEAMPLEVTPSRPVLDQGRARFDGGVRQRFPHDRRLRDLEAESFLGLRLTNSAGRPIGVLALIHDAPLDDARQPEAILQICASRAAAELERMHMEERLVDLAGSAAAQVEQRTGELAQAKARLESQLHQLAATQARLRESERMYRTLVETMSDGLAMVNTDGVMTYVNRRMCEILGRPESEVVGRRPTDFIATPEQADWFRQQQRRREQGTLTHYPLDLRRADGTVVHTLVAPRSLFDEAGRFTGSFGVVTELPCAGRPAPPMERASAESS